MSPATYDVAAAGDNLVIGIVDDAFIVHPPSSPTVWGASNRQHKNLKNFFFSSIYEKEEHIASEVN